MPLPNFLVPGVAKCGTTTLARLLAEHPDVFIPPEKEVDFFWRDYLWKRGPEWYAEVFSGHGGARAIGEATPTYTFYPWVVERIAATLPGVRLVVCLRDPVERAYSHYLHWREGMGFEPRSFRRAVEDELATGGDEVAEHRLGDDPPYFGYLARGLYLPQLERLVATFGRDRLHVVLLDDLKSDPRGTYAGVCRFLGVDDGFVPPGIGTRENPFQRHRFPGLFRLLIRHRVLQRLPQRPAEAFVRTVLRPRPVPVPPMDPDVRARLAGHFAEPNARLAEWLGRDLSHWT